MGALHRTSRSHWVRIGIAVALMLLVVGCAPASGAKYSRHLNMSHSPSHVNAESYEAAQRLYGDAQAAKVLAGAFDDDVNDER